MTKLKKNDRSNTFLNEKCVSTDAFIPLSVSLCSGLVLVFILPLM